MLADLLLGHACLLLVDSLSAQVMPGLVAFMFDNAVEDTCFLSSQVFLSSSSFELVVDGESVSGGGVAAREDPGGLLEREKELSLRVPLAAVILRCSASTTSPTVLGSVVGQVLILTSGVWRALCMSGSDSLESSLGVFRRCSLLLTKEPTRRPRPRLLLCAGF